MMRAAILSVFLMFGASSAFAGPKPEALSPLAREFAAKRETLLHKYAARRKAMIETRGWQELTEKDQKAKLDALAKELNSKDDKLTADYEARKLASKEMEDVRARQAEQDRLDEIRIHAAQDIQRSKLGH